MKINVKKKREAQNMEYLDRLLVFALFEDDFISFIWPQASLPSAAQPAVMDIRRLRRRSLEMFSYFKFQLRGKNNRAY